MFAFVWAVSVRTGMLARRFMPTIRLLDALHTRRGLKWGVPAMLLAVPYGLAAAAFAGMADAGGWFSVFALLFAWNACKFLVAGPVTAVRLLRVRAREVRSRRIFAMLELEAKAEVGSGVGERQLDPALQR